MHLQPVDYAVVIFYGIFLLVLAQWVSPWWLLFTVFIGLNLLQSGLTGWCLMEDILRWTGIHRES